MHDAFDNPFGKKKFLNLIKMETRLQNRHNKFKDQQPNALPTKKTVK